MLQGCRGRRLEPKTRPNRPPSRVACCNKLQRANASFFLPLPRPLSPSSSAGSSLPVEMIHYPSRRSTTRRDDPSIAWNARIDRERPVVDPSSEALHIVETVGLEEHRRIERANTVMAIDDDGARPVEFVETLGELVERDQHRAGERGGRVLAGLAYVGQKRPFGRRGIDQFGEVSGVNLDI